MPEPCGKCDLFGCDHGPVTASDARPPSDTGTTGWHRHGDRVVRDNGSCVSRDRPVIVVDPVEARETIARTLREWLESGYDDTDDTGYQAGLATAAVLAALANQEGTS